VIAVSDTSPFNYLILLEEIDLLPRLFEEVWILPPSPPSWLIRAVR